MTITTWLVARLRREAVPKRVVLRTPTRCRAAKELDVNCGPHRAPDTIHGWFVQRVRLAGDSTALLGEGIRYSYEQLNRTANRLAHHLLAEDLQPEAVVAIHVDRGPLAVVCQLAVMKAGGAYLAIDKGTPASRMDYMFSDASVVRVLTDDPSLVSEYRAVRCVDVRVLSEFPDIDHEPDVAVGPDWLAHIIYTSGSTGEPKGVARTHRAVVNHVAWLGALLPYEQEHTVLHLTSLSFVRGVWELYTPLVAGLRVAMFDVRSDLPKLLETVSRYGASRIATSPSLLRALIRAPGAREFLHDIRCWYVSGEQLKPTLVQEAHTLLPSALICNVYGATEIGPATAFPMRAGQPLPAVVIGPSDPAADVYVLDRDGRSTAPMEIGEIVVGGKNLPRAYLNRAAQSGAALVPDAQSGRAGERLYRTGDLGYVDRNGSITLVGRADHLVKIRGFRVELGEVEEALRRHPAVEAAAVSARPDTQGNLSLTAYAVFGGEEPGWPALRAFLLRTLPHYMVPTAWARLDAMPLTPNGKIDRAGLAKYGATTKAMEAKDVQSDNLAYRVAQAWEHALGALPAPSDEFFSCGGNSLLAAQVIARLAHTLGVRLPAHSLFLFPTLAGFTEHVRNMCWLLPGEAPARLSWEVLS